MDLSPGAVNRVDSRFKVWEPLPLHHSGLREDHPWMVNPPLVSRLILVLPIKGCGNDRGGK